jgi:hypothetical protein
MAEDTEINNVIDFTEHKLLRLEGDAAHKGDFSLAMAIGEALKRYKEGSISIHFKDGNPYILMPDTDYIPEEEIEDNT